MCLFLVNASRMSFLFSRLHPMAIVLPLPTFSARLEQNKALLSLDCILDPGHFTLTHRSLTEGRVGSLERLRAVRRGRGTSVTISPASMFEPHSNI